MSDKFFNWDIYAVEENSSKYQTNKWKSITQQTHDSREYLTAILIHRDALNSNTFVNIISCNNILWVRSTWIMNIGWSKCIPNCDVTVLTEHIYVIYLHRINNHHPGSRKMHRSIVECGCTPFTFNVVSGPILEMTNPLLCISVKKWKLGH